MSESAKLYAMLRVKDRRWRHEQDYFAPMHFDDEGTLWLHLTEIFTDVLERVRTRADFIVRFYGDWMQPVYTTIIYDRWATLVQLHLTPKDDVSSSPALRGYFI